MKGDVVPSISKYIEMGLDSWDEGIVTAEDVKTAGQIQMPILFQLVQNMVEVGGNRSEHIPPQSLNSVSSKGVENISTWSAL